MIEAFVERHWQERTWISRTLWPVSALYCLFMRLHRQSLESRPTIRLPVPVVVVGNISVGGTGKTPLVAWIARLLADNGYQPGVIARGYRGRARQWPQRVGPGSDPREVGDEAVLLARRGWPVAVGPERVAAARLLIDQCGCTVIVSDDGLQHQRLRRDVEIAVIDGVRRFGNGYCLPAGPLREPVSRLTEVDACVTQGDALEGEWGMRIVGDQFVNVAHPDRIRCAAGFCEPVVHAVAGIGRPRRFFDHLRALGLNACAHPFPDHHAFVAADLGFAKGGSAVIMTEKDAVKCERFARDNFWFLQVDAVLDPGFGILMLGLVKEVSKGG